VHKITERTKIIFKCDTIN